MIYTIGYEGAQLEDFIATLVEHQIDILVDVRDRAQSRKRGFSKSALSSALCESGIEYLHLRELGDPREGRIAARAREWERFNEIYSEVIASPAAQDALRRIVQLAAHSRAALMCFERCHDDCHRSIVADWVVDLGGGTTMPIEVKQFDASGSMRHRCEGATA